MWTKTALAAAAVALLAAALAGCGGDDPDLEAAKTALLIKDDLPNDRYGSGWDSVAPEEGSGVGRCVNLDFPGLVVTAKAQSRFFFSSELGAADSVAGVYAGSAAPVLEQLADRVKSCRSRSWAESSRDYGYAPPTARPIALPRMGERSRAFEIRTGFGDDDIVVIQKGRTVAVLSFQPDSGCPRDYCSGKKGDIFFHHAVVALARAVAARM